MPKAIKKEAKKIISIIIPVYNGEKYIKRCLDAIFLTNENKQFEVIVVDDGSIDNSLKIVQEYQKEEQRLIILHHSNHGVSYSRNQGIKVANGEYIMFCDCDDIYEKRLVDNNMEKIQKYKSDLIIFNRCDFQQKKMISCLANIKDINQYTQIDSYLVEKFSKGKTSFSVCNKIYKKEVITKNRLCFKENIKYSEDLLFNLDYISSINTILENFTCTYIRFCNHGSTLYHKIEKFFTKNIRILQEYHKALDDEEKIRMSACIANLYSHYGIVAINRLISGMDANTTKEINQEIVEIYQQFKNQNLKLKREDSMKIRLICYLFNKGNLKLLTILGFDIGNIVRKMRRILTK